MLFSDLFQRRREESSRLKEEGNEQFKKGGKIPFSTLMLGILTHSFVVCEEHLETTSKPKLLTILCCFTTPWNFVFYQVQIIHS